MIQQNLTVLKTIVQWEKKQNRSKINDNFENDPNYFYLNDWKKRRKYAVHRRWTKDMKKCRSCPSLVVELHEVINVNLSFVQTFFSIIGSVRENEIGYGLTANNNSFSSLLILLLSFASIRRKLLKTTYTEEQSINTNSESFKNS